MSSPDIPTEQWACVIEKTGGPVEYKKIPVQKPGPDEVLINIKYSGVCHTDLHAVKGDWPLATKLPLVGGHEGAGVVVAKGEQVQDIEIGDHAGVKVSTVVGRLTVGMESLTLGCSGSMVLVLLATSASSLTSRFARRYIVSDVARWAVLTRFSNRLFFQATQSTAHSSNTPLPKQLMLRGLTNQSHSMQSHQSCVLVLRCTSMSRPLPRNWIEAKHFHPGVSRSRVRDLVNQSPLSVLEAV